MTYERSRLGWAVAVILLVAGCSEIEPPLLPALPATSPPSYTAGRIVWADLLTSDIEAAEQFYGPLFAWTFEKTKADDYRLVAADGGSIAGFVENDQDGEGEAIWLPYLSVPDVDRSSREAASALGRILMKPKNAPDRGRVSVVTDGEGAVIVLLQSFNGDPPPRPTPLGGILWWDLWTHDPSAAARFYGKVAGLKTETLERKDGSTRQVLGRGTTVTGGLVKLPWDDAHSNWLPYVRVDDVAATTRRAVQLGGTVIARTEDTAVLQDPEGAALGIQEIPSANGGGS